MAKAIKNQGNVQLLHIPNLTFNGQSATTPMEKAELLRQKFFLPPVATDLSDIDSFNSSDYPESLLCPDITGTEIKNTIINLKLGKAPGIDKITNGFLRGTASVILLVIL